MIKMKFFYIFIILCLALSMTGIFFPKSSNAAQSDTKHMKELTVEQIDKGAQMKEEKSPQPEIIRPKLEYKAQGLKDPFQPLVQKNEVVNVIAGTPENVQSLPSLTLQGLVWGGDFPQAIINNRVVKIGDIIGEAEVADIGKEGVVVIYAKKKYKLAAPSVTGPTEKIISKRRK